MRKYSKVLLAGLVASMMVGCQAEEKKETPVPTVDVNVQATVEPTEEPQNLVEHEYVKDNENNKVVTSTVAYKIKEKQHPANGQVWTSKVEECDKDGNILKEIYYVDENIESSYNEYTYNAKGNVLTEKSYTGGEMYMSRTYEYDSYGDLVKETEIRPSLGKESITDYKYLYDGDCKVKSIVYDSNGEIGNFIHYKYDENKRLIREMHYNGTDTLVYEWEYDYDDRGNVITMIYIEGGSSYEVSLSYDSNNNLIEKKQTEFGEITNWEQYKYNSSNGLIEEIILEKDGTVHSIDKITRDEKNRAIKEVSNYDGVDRDSWEEWEYVEVK